VPSRIALVADGIDFRSSIHADLPEGHAASTTSANRPALTTRERAARLQAVRYANASIALEGMKPSTQADLRAQRFVDGLLDLDEFLSN
jgi:hypothetical protein